MSFSEISSDATSYTYIYNVFFLFMSKDVATRKITKAKMIHDN